MKRLTDILNTSVNEEAIERRCLVESEDEIYLILEGPHGVQECAIRDFNGFGLSFVLPEQFIDISQLTTCLEHIRIFQGKSLITIIPSAQIVSTTPYRPYQLLVDIAFAIPHATDPHLKLWEQINIHDEWLPAIHFVHPILYERNILGKVVTFTKFGVLASISVQNNDLLPYATISHMTLTMSGIGNITCCVQVEDIRFASDFPDQIFLYLKFLKTEKAMCELFGQLLVIHGKIQLPHINLMEVIRRAGLYPRRIKKHLKFSYLTTRDEYLEVLKLRLQAYSRVGKVPESLSYLEMADVYDDISKIIICRHQDRIVGSIRVTFCAAHEDRYELEESVTLPLLFRNRMQCAEMSRLCVHSDYWGTDIVIGLIERGFIHTLKTGRKFIITSCSHDMWSFYRGMGFKKGGITFELKTLHGVPHLFIYIKVRQGLTGIGMNPSVFYLFFSNIVRFSTYQRTKILRVGIIERIWIFMNEWMGRVLLAFVSYRRNKKSR